MNKLWKHFDRQFTPNAVKLLFWFTLIYGFSAACSKNVNVKKNAKLGVMPTWCFRADFADTDEAKTYSWNCFVYNYNCRAALKVAKSYGSLANVTSLTECQDIRGYEIQDKQRNTKLKAQIQTHSYRCTQSW